MSELQISQVEYELVDGQYIETSTEPQPLRGTHVPTEVDYDELVTRLEDGNETYQVTEDRNGMMHETVLFNADQASNAIVLKPSTSFSGALKNPGNMLETALAATLNPNAAYLYVTSDGNYPTGHLSSAEREYRRKTGRVTTGNGTEENPYDALDSTKDLVDMLDEQGRVPTHLTADQEAGRNALAIMTALGKNTISGAHLNGIDGISPTASYVKAPFIEDMQSRVRRRQIGDGQIGELTPVNIKDVKQRMPNIYKGLGSVAHIAPLPLLLFPLDVRDKIGLTMGYRGHKDLRNLADHAVYHDMSAALQQQEAKITMQFNSSSHQHDLEDCKTFGLEISNGIPTDIRSAKRGVRLLLSEGNWAQNTDAPYEAARIQRLALSDIGHAMTSYVGNRLLDADILELPALRQVS